MLIGVHKSTVADLRFLNKTDGSIGGVHWYSWVHTSGTAIHVTGLASETF